METQTEQKIYLADNDSYEIPDNFKITSLKDLQAAEEESVDEIFIRSFLGSVSDEKFTEFVQDLLTKTKPDGYIHIQDIDIEQFALYLSNRVLPISSKNILYSDRNNIFYMGFVIERLRAISNVKIVQTNFINGYEFYVKIQKN